jgi:hypothetical protein
MKLDEDSFMIYAAKYYDMAKAASVEEFHEDLKRFQYLKRLFKRYDEDNELRVRLILNHLIVLYNCFGPMSTNMLFMKLEDYHKYLKPFILFLNYLPEYIEYGDNRIPSNMIPMDPIIIEELRKI